MQRMRHNQGLTSVELLVATISGAILAITAGSMLAHGYRSWSNNSIAVELQRDATAAMEMLTWKVRPASSSRVTVLTNRVEIQPVDTFADPTIAFEMDGSDFVFDPDVATDDDEIVVIDGNVENLIFTNLNFGISVYLSLEKNDEAAKINSILSYRN